MTAGSRKPERTFRNALRRGLSAGLPAAVLSGIPSTAHAVATRADPLEASAAAGSILLPNEERTAPLLVAAVPVHLALTLGWAVVLAATLPLKRPVVEGAAAGLAIAAVDLGMIGRRFPRIRALQPLPQVADHVAFGLVTALALARRS
jgi:hypothetical protein